MAKQKIPPSTDVALDVLSDGSEIAEVEAAATDLPFGSHSTQSVFVSAGGVSSAIYIQYDTLFLHWIGQMLKFIYTP